MTQVRQQPSGKAPKSNEASESPSVTTPAFLAVLTHLKAAPFVPLKTFGAGESLSDLFVREIAKKNSNLSSTR
jgi:hypothetical protein